MRRTAAASSWAILMIVFTLSLAMPVYAADPAMEKVLPGGFYKDWTPEAKVSFFNRDTLFEHINGEAELYLPYGFDVLATAGYVNKKRSDVLVVADVYRMGSLLDAFGIYANYRKAEYESVQLGGEGFISSTQMMFYQDRYFVRLQATGTTSLERDIFLDCAQQVSRNLPVNASRPKELDVLSIAAVVPKSERYLAQSLLGYAFFRRGMIADAVTAGAPMRVFVVSEESAASARKAFDAYRSYLAEEGQGIRISGTQDRMILTAVDALYGDVFMEQSGRYLIGVLKVKDKDAAKRLVDQLKEKMDAVKAR
jgi:hypothetical protein